MTARKTKKEYAARERHPNWKGDEVGYKALHAWLNANFPRSGCCELCGTTEKRTEYASKGRYSRERSDYLEVCRPCHTTMDGRDNPPTTTREKMSAAARGRSKPAQQVAKMAATRRQRNMARDKEICRRYARGDSAQALAVAYGLSQSRIFQLVASRTA